MNILSEKKLENAVIELEIEVPVERVEEEYKSVFSKLQKKAKIDGFRQGKAPMQIVEKKYQEYAGEEVAENLARGTFYEAIKNKELVPIVEPRISFDVINREEPFKYKAMFEVMPSIQIGDYQGIEAEETVCDVKDDDIQTEVDTIRERFADVTPITDDNAEIVKGNLVKFKMKRIDDVQADEIEKVEFREFSVIVGKSKDDHALDKHLTGMKKGEEKNVTIKYPDNYQIKDLASKEITYLVNIIEISDVKLPEFNDELAVKGGYESAEDMKKKTRDYLEKYVGDKIKAEVRTELITKIIDKSTFDIPESMVYNEMYSIFKKTQQRVGYNADTIEQFAAALGLDPEEYRERLKEDANISIRHTLILSEIAKKEDFKVTDEEYQQKVMEFSGQLGKSVAEIEEMISANDSRPSIENDMILEKSMDFIYEKGNIKKLANVSLEDFLKSKMNQ